MEADLPGDFYECIKIRVRRIERGQVLWATGFRAAREPAVR